MSCLFHFPPKIAQLEPSMTFRLSHPIARFPERRLGQNMAMLAGNRQANDQSAESFQAVEDGHAHNCSRLVGDNHRRLFERRMATLFQVFVGPGRRRIFVIAFYVLAMMASTKAARVSIKPRTIRGDNDMIPLLVLIHCDRALLQAPGAARGLGESRTLDYAVCKQKALLRHAPESDRGISTGGESAGAVGGEENAADFIRVTL